MDDKRFADGGLRIEEFSDEFLVVCPKCAKMCKVTIDGADDGAPAHGRVFLPRKVTCVHCGFANRWAKQSVSYMEGRDWYFALPLWLQIPCCGEELWVFNERHLDFLENYVRATLRDETSNVNKSLISRLPSWIKSSKNREKILQALQKLRAKL
jgi:hypothetical protein